MSTADTRHQQNTPLVVLSIVENMIGSIVRGVYSQNQWVRHYLERVGTHHAYPAKMRVRSAIRFASHV